MHETNFIGNLILYKKGIYGFLHNFNILSRIWIQRFEVIKIILNWGNKIWLSLNWYSGLNMKCMIKMMWNDFVEN